MLVLLVSLLLLQDEATSITIDLDPQSNLLLKDITSHLVGAAPGVGPILQILTSIFWPKSGGGEPPAVKALRRDMEKQYRKIDNKIIIAAQKAFEKSYGKFTDSFKRLREAHDNGSTSINLYIMATIGRVQNLQQHCDAIEGKLVTDSENRKFGLPYYAISAVMCMEFYKEVLQNFTDLYRGQTELMKPQKDMILCWMAETRNTFVKYGQKAYDEWDAWRKGQIRWDCDSHTQTGRSTMSESSLGWIVDDTGDNHSSEACRRGHWWECHACFRSIKWRWFGKSYDRFGVSWKPMQADNLDAYLKDLGTPDMSRCG